MDSTWAPKEGTKIDTLLKAMRAVAAAQPIWTQAEAAKVMDIPRANVPAYIAGACNAHALFRRTLAHGCGIELSLERFPSHEFAPPPSVDLQIPTFTSRPGFVPAPMVAPRPGSEHPRVLASSPRPAPLGGHHAAPPQPPVSESEAAADAALVGDGERAAPAPAQEVTNPPAPAAVSPLPPAAPSGEVPPESGEVNGDSGELVTEDEEQEFDFCAWKDGGLQLWGVQAFEDGSFKLTSAQLWEIRKATAWMRPPREEQPA